MITPWGKSDNKEVLADGIVFYSTPRHGGFKVNKKQNQLIPVSLRNDDGWYEEDCECLKVIHSFPELFPKNDQTEVKKSIAYWFKINL